MKLFIQHFIMAWFTWRLVFMSKLGQIRPLLHPLRLLQMLLSFFPSLLSISPLLLNPLQLALLWLGIFHVFSMGRINKLSSGLNLDKIELRLNRTHSRYLFEPRLQATVARRLIMTETTISKSVCHSVIISLTYRYK